MKRITTNLSDRQYKAMKPLLEPGHGALAKFVREAIEEKVHRDLVLAHVEQLREDLDDALLALRSEMDQTRRTLAQDNERAVTHMSEAAAASMRKSEQMQKAFLLALAGALNGTPAASPPG